MRRSPRRHKCLQISVFFFIYSIIHVLSDHPTTKPEPADISETKGEIAKSEIAKAETKTEAVKPTKPRIKSEESSDAKAPPKNEEKPTATNLTMNSTPELKTKSEGKKPGNNELKANKTRVKQEAVNSKTENKIATTMEPESTLRKSLEHKNVSSNDTKGPPCIRPAIEQFPRPLIGRWARQHGALIIHLIVAVYTFLGLAIVCDEYFVASLDRICEELKMSPDVAGATFMAAGSSAPELATVIIGVFFAKDDIGISGVIGSAVFNIMFVISVCGLCTTTAVYLNWWPLIRDCFFYAVSILIMLITIQDEMISWPESLFMLIMYLVYCVVLHYNTFLEQWAQTLPVPCKKVNPDEQSGLMTYKTLTEDATKPPSYGCTPDDRPNAAFENLSGPALNQQPTQQQQPIAQDYYKPKEYDPTKIVDPLVKPLDAGVFRQSLWAILYPIHFLCRKTMPDCRSEEYKNWYPFTFFISMVWISFYSYIMVWMITVIGSTFGIPDTVMGLTFVAAGVSVPDALSSVAVIKEGYGDMAVSNAVGSNVFDILICLGLPWFIKTAIINPGQKVKVISKGLTYSTLSLLSTVIFLVGATHLNGWKLDRKFGIILMIWYLIFITLASLYEMNVFGKMNPDECETEY